MKRDTLGIISVVLAILLAPIGLVVSVIALIHHRALKKSIVLPLIGVIISVILLPAIILSIGTITYFIANSDETSTNMSAPVELTGLSIAQCLTNNGVVMYGSDSCPACRQQKTFFDDFEEIEYIECDKDRSACQSAGIRSIPTWVRGDERLVGSHNLEDLAVFGGCEAQ
jgi:hypothetical protein